MAVKVRGVSDHLTLESALLGALLVLVGASTALLSPHSTFGRQTVETPKQTNERIQQLAAQARSRPVETPIGAGDLLHIDVFDVPELSRDLRVMNTGEISFPLIPGKVQVAGLSAFQLQAKLAQLLLENGLVSHPQVSVFVKEQTSQPVSVVGAVPHQMVYQVLRPTTLLEVLADAGGIADDAGPNVVVTRSRHPEGEKVDASPAPPDSPDGNPGTNSYSGNSNPPAHTNTASPDPASDPPPQDAEIVTIRLQDLLESADSQYDIPIHGGDVVRVPKAGIIYVLGAGISSPGGYILQGHGEDVTALKVVAIAHGWTTFAKPDDSVILRTNPATGKREQIPVHLKKIEKNKFPDVVVKTNDILYVPDSKGKKALAQGTASAVAIGTGLALYRVAY